MSACSLRVTLGLFAVSVGITSLPSVRLPSKHHPAYLNPTVDLVGHSYSGRLGGGYNERLVNFGLGVLFQTGK